ncbi:hypothetical protein PGTUg99_022857 [Puccinia graminis f. sp. tritici]|uniref:Large ribosomal subunit protein uL11 N-terminal domain-containing protein n=1 Tax=Puccinia graminis f. sp. tritici TaxID=56615 RepID=A0A5B0QH55_PUCGR|nr:hypothetical protein PGTUg99_022857 [Puccinia graminis f. sp. tritici]
MSAPTTNLVVEAGKASPSPPVGPALGSRGIKAMDFCKLFNAQTSHIEPTIPIRVNMTINAKDKSYKFKTKLTTNDLLHQETSQRIISIILTLINAIILILIILC